MHLETTIVGAGPYGLSIAAHLRAANRPFQMYGRPMESWRTFMPKGMILKSEPFASNLWDPHRRYTFERYCQTEGMDYQPIGRPLSLERFLKYADWFRERTQVEPDDVLVTAVRHERGQFALDLADGRQVTSRRVVLATGHMAYAVMPTELVGLPEPLVTHCSRMDAVDDYAGKDVTVIGAGQSALETAALLHEAHARVRIIVREDRIRWNARSGHRSALSRLRAPDAGLASGWEALAVSELPRVFRRMFSPEKRHRYVASAFGPSGAWWLRERVDGRIDSWQGSRVMQAAAQDHRVRLTVATPQGPTEVITDRVIAATGYRVDIDRLSYLSADLKHAIRREAGGIPALSATFETSVPGLYIVGISSAPVFGSVMRFMFGAKHAAPILLKGLREH